MSPELLFSPKKIGNKTAMNRFVAQPMEANDALADGSPSEQAIKRYASLAAGGWGIIIIEALCVSLKTRARINGIVINRYSSGKLKELVAETKKQNPETLVFIQISHAGQKAYPVKNAVSVFEHPGKYRILGKDEIKTIRKQFVEAVFIAAEAGADGVDLKLCHGYFGAEILRPSNQRADRWGGSYENRTRFISEILEEIRSGKNCPDLIIGSRISMYEGIRGACGTVGQDELVEDLSEMKKLSHLLVSLGADYINVSAGIPGVTSAITRPTAQSTELFLHHLRYTKTVKQWVGKDIAVFGSGYSSQRDRAFLMGEESISKGHADFIGFGRQIFADPLTPQKVKTGKSPNLCILCSGCSKLLADQKEVGCKVFSPYYKQQQSTPK